MPLNKEMKRKELILLAVVAVFITALSKYFIEIPNFSPIGAIALMSGAFISRKLWAFILPLAALFLADILIMGTSPIYQDYFWTDGMFFTYVGFILTVGVGILISRKVSLVSVLGGGLAAALIFFLFSNFGAFLFLGQYAKNWGGLMEAYANGIPFFRSTLISQLLFSVALYYAYSWSTRKKVVLA